MTATKGHFPPGDLETERDADQTIFRTDRAKQLPRARREAHVRQALERLPLREPDAATTRRTTSASGRTSRDELAVLWERMCPAQVYEAADGDSVEVTPSNCVQCGAITAKGGRLTPPEGGAGPEYTLT